MQEKVLTNGGAKPGFLEKQGFELNSLRKRLHGFQVGDEPGSLALGRKAGSGGEHCWWR